MTELILDCALDALKDGALSIPILFLAYLLMEMLENSKRLDEGILHSYSRKAGPALGGLLGAIPQCGISGAAATLFSTGSISAGTMLAVFFATSDEMLPVMLSSLADGKGATDIGQMAAIVAAKAVMGIVLGYLVDAFGSRLFARDKNIHSFCEREHCECDEEEGSVWLSALKHTVKIAVMLIAVTFALNIILELVGIERLAVCEVHIVRADARAVLVIADGVVFRARERDFLRGVKGRDGIVEDHIPQHRAELVQRVVADQVSLAVAGGDIPLLVHLAEITELDGIGFLASCDGDRANWLCQTVLCVILHIVNGKRRREVLKLRKQIVDFPSSTGNAESPSYVHVSPFVKENVPSSFVHESAVTVSVGMERIVLPLFLICSTFSSWRLTSTAVMLTTAKTASNAQRVICFLRMASAPPLNDCKHTVDHECAGDHADHPRLEHRRRRLGDRQIVVAQRLAAN